MAGSKQVTINQSFYDKMNRLSDIAKEKVWTKGEEVVSYAVAISPVWSGAYVESFSVRERGDSSGLMRKSKYDPDAPDSVNKEVKKSPSEVAALKEQEAARLRSEVRSVDPLEEKGFTLRNRAPHAQLVEDKLGHAVFRRTKARFTG